MRVLALVVSLMLAAAAADGTIQISAPILIIGGIVVVPVGVVVFVRWLRKL